MKKTDKIVVRNSGGRRQFIRAGAALLLGGSAVAQAQEESFRTDCDSQGFSGEKNTEVAGNDSDTGATGDRPGCGSKKPPVMTEYRKKSPGDVSVRVTKVKA